jgi:hypothetical protein
VKIYLWIFPKNINTTFLGIYSYKYTYSIVVKKMLETMCHIKNVN